MLYTHVECNVYMYVRIQCDISLCCILLVFHNVLILAIIIFLSSTDRIVPQIPSSKEPPKSSNSSDDVGVRSPGAKPKFEGIRLPSDSIIPKQIQVIF